MKERWNLYDSNKNLTNDFIYRGDAVPKDRFYLTVLVWIENSKGEILLQLTSPEKKSQWATTGGHAKFGQNSMQGIQTEIEEELGIKVNTEELTLLKTIHTADDFVDVYYLKKDIDLNKCILQKDEVADIEWFSYQEIQEKINNQDLNEDHVEFYNYLYEHLNEHKKHHF